jgi:hypothetical protein
VDPRDDGGLASDKVSDMRSLQASPSRTRILGIGFVVGLLLNVTGWMGNNLVLGSLWQQVGASVAATPWRASLWSDVVSLLPDFVYGLAIAWLCVVIRPRYAGYVAASFRAGLLIALVGGITTYLALANSGFVPWNLALASFGLVLGTKLPLALLAGRLLEPPSGG